MMNACAGLVVLSLAGGCSSSDKSTKDGGSDNSTPTTAPVEGVDTTTGAPSGPPVTGVIERYEGTQGDGIADSVTTDHCDTKPGNATAAGSVQLPAGKNAADVIINVGWVNSKTGTVIAKRIVEVKGVKADVPSQWSTEVDIPENADVTIRCNVGAFLKG